ncbi:hypothetical protein [Nocardioides convexus]|uniref:hypothetical protein n=1 Tax=Nocardioides convexus TaxID=2712224 RepID=UPI0024189518|nr:hypothetical protein [Nocardioides convexus]
MPGSRAARAAHPRHRCGGAGRGRDQRGDGRTARPRAGHRGRQDRRPGPVRRARHRRRPGRPRGPKGPGRRRPGPRRRGRDHRRQRHPGPAAALQRGADARGTGPGPAHRGVGRQRQPA